jgi:transcription antitermination factor NusG
MEARLIKDTKMNFLEDLKDTYKAYCMTSVKPSTIDIVYKTCLIKNIDAVLWMPCILKKAKIRNKMQDKSIAVIEDTAFLFLPASLDNEGLYNAIKNLKDGKSSLKFLTKEGNILPIAMSVYEIMEMGIGEYQEIVDSEYAIGKRVRIISGTFKHLTGIIEKVNDDMCDIVISIFQRETRMKTSKKNLEIIE